MSNGKKMIALVLATFIALIVVGAVWSGKGGDTTGANTGTAADVIAAQGLTGDTVPPSQVGINAVANEAGHLRVAVNFSWLLMTGFLVLFMQVGFAFLVTGLTRAKNAGPHDDDERRRVRYRARRVLRGRLRVPVRRRWRQSRTSVGPVRLSGLFPHGNCGPHRAPRVLPAERPRLRRRRDRRSSCSRSCSWRRPGTSSSARSPSGSRSPAFIARRDRDGGDHLPASTATGSGAAASWPISGQTSTGATAPSTSPVPASCTPPADGRPSPWRSCSARASASSTRDGSPNAFPGHNIGYVVIGTMILSVRLDGLQPRLDLRRHRSPHLDRRGQHAARPRASASSRRCAYTNARVRQARHLDVVQRHARRPGRDHCAVRVRRAVGGRR